MHHNHEAIVMRTKSKTSKLAKLKKRLSTHFECFALNHNAASNHSTVTANPAADLTSGDDGTVEMLKFTSLNSENALLDNGNNHSPVVIGDAGEQSVHNTHKQSQQQQQQSQQQQQPMPPKPPPRSTSIYHLQRLQQTLKHNGDTDVVMRDKSTLASNQSRPKSDMFEVSNYLKNHIITGANAAQPQSNRPQSMYVDNSQPDSDGGRPVKHSISRFSAYEISVRNIRVC